MDGEKRIVTPAQAAHEEEMRMHRNGAMNIPHPVPEFTGKLLLWTRRAPEDGPGMYRYTQAPSNSERGDAEPEPQSNSAENIESGTAAKKAALAQVRADTEQSIAEGQDRGRSR